MRTTEDFTDYADFKDFELCKGYYIKHPLPEEVQERIMGTCAEVYPIAVALIQSHGNLNKLPELILEPANLNFVGDSRRSIDYQLKSMERYYNIELERGLRDMCWEIELFSKVFDIDTSEYAYALAEVKATYVH